MWEAECPELEGLLQRHYNVCSTITKSIKKKTKVSFFVFVFCKAAFKTFYEERLKYLKKKHTTKLQITKEEISAASCRADSLSQPHSAKFAITMIFFFFPAENEARIVSLATGNTENIITMNLLARALKETLGKDKRTRSVVNATRLNTVCLSVRSRLSRCLPSAQKTFSLN